LIYIVFNAIVDKLDDATSLVSYIMNLLNSQLKGHYIAVI